MSFTNTQNPPFSSYQQEELQIEDGDIISQQKAKKSNARGKKAVQSRARKPGKKDRHSKINTAQGPRDRRMRLSLQIARKFFDLQDKLGFDKASKTIDWLFTKSKAAIKELTGNADLPSQEVAMSPNNNIPILECEENVVEVKKENKCRNTAIRMFNRDKARARARDRTIEKMNIRSFNEISSKQYFEENPNFYVGCSSNPYENFDSTEKMSGGQFEDHRNGNTPLERQMATVGIIEELLGVEPSMTILNNSCDGAMYSNDDFLGLDQGDWSSVENNGNNEYMNYYAAMDRQIYHNIDLADVDEENPMTTSSSLHGSRFSGN